MIPEGNQYLDPACNAGEVVKFHSMTHDQRAYYKGYLLSVTTYNGRKAGIAEIIFTT